MWCKPNKFNAFHAVFIYMNALSFMYMYIHRCILYIGTRGGVYILYGYDGGYRLPPPPLSHKTQTSHGRHGIYYLIFFFFCQQSPIATFS